ncbi:glutathione-dependent disulfide-bond oxidoreductase [Pseudomonas tolaasii]|uniref:Glutathione-dependent disulfide-bond oxidoreductase n=2 Tax=Pseudomonas tolaasii TaxID=29442 RepID=A0A7Y8AW22_PSETO|nr:glutathione-dependent disulfide-bond oxidoreductase [Pseudomonas tolaasii]ARB27419.1 thiol:disulfide oxidoreductase [Pseudomonas tolaasii]KAB0467474.1 glutathione-dependent disulfide-bond oxidoreductase [Pseudomonas tolaasii]MBY8943316.1 glutathione-dependent disulfide-bond oxidoreductase [Pseudomonas tolaasii]NWC21776.1 glutathione-dependent disulfide-bond oxidoreductase [Pseudomonas tolaasii]NWC30523.1 glutathione-dependent disulfide-bond oxidoreductase [Pseudomonas tolaasii]
MSANPLDNQPAGYVPANVWTPKNTYGGQFGSINQPVSGARFEQSLPVGKHPLQLYSQGTPNGQKITIMLEELLAAGHPEAEYDAWLIDIFKGDQFGSGFVEINPNSKIPALVDHSTTPPTRVFESGSILVYLAERFGAFLPSAPKARAETFNWLMWQMGSAPFVGGGLGHFYAYAPIKIEYAIDRYAMETKRQLHVLDTHLASHEYLAGDDYTIADMAVWPWYPGSLYGVYNTHAFLAVEQYTHLLRWYQTIAKRPAVARGSVVNRRSDVPGQYLLERHDASDFNSLS